MIGDGKSPVYTDSGINNFKFLFCFLAWAGLEYVDEADLKLEILLLRLQA
jgi:hypothetical protein